MGYMKYFFSIGFLLVNLCSGFVFNPFQSSPIIRSHIAHASPLDNDYHYQTENINLKTSFGYDEEYHPKNLDTKPQNDFFYAKEYYNFLIEYNIIKGSNFLLYG